MTRADPSISDAELAPMALFSELPHHELAAIASSARVQRCPAGTRIFNQGDAEARMHAVVEGCVRITQAGSDGAEVVMRFIGTGEMFGTVALFTDKRYPADATTLVETIEASWSNSDLEHMMSQYPQVSINMIRIIGLRLQEAQFRIRELSTQRAERRIAHTLIRLMRQAGCDTAAGMTIAFPLRRKDVADIAGTTLHTASRILTAWEKAGLIVSQQRKLTIRHSEDLLRIAKEPTL